jgi:hypothetical protein
MNLQGNDWETYAILAVGFGVGYFIVSKLMDYFGANRPDQRPGQGDGYPPLPPNGTNEENRHR